MVFVTHLTRSWCRLELALSAMNSDNSDE